MFRFRLLTPFTLALAVIVLIAAGGAAGLIAPAPHHQLESLMWTLEGIYDYQGGTWDDAGAAAVELEEGGYTDWRLPTVAEVEAAIADGSWGTDGTRSTGVYWTADRKGNWAQVYRLTLNNGVPDPGSLEFERMWWNGRLPFKAVREDVGVGGDAFVDCITYNTSGGPNGDKHLQITVAITDDLGNAVGNASVSIAVFLDGNLYDAVNATTDGSGNASFSFGNAPSGLYDVDVTEVEATGFSFDGSEPVNAFDKGTDPAPASFGCCGC